MLENNPNNSVFKKKFNFVVQIEKDGIKTEDCLVKISLPLEIPGKSMVNKISFADFKAEDEFAKSIFGILSNYYEDNKSSDYKLNLSDKNKVTIHLRMYDGLYNLLESWVLYGCFPTNLEFIDLSVNETYLIAEFSYSDAKMLVNRSRSLDCPHCQKELPANYKLDNNISW